MQSLRTFLRPFGQALSLSFWRQPDRRPDFGGFGGFLAACALALVAYVIQDFYVTKTPAEFYGDGFHVHASYFLILLIAAWLAARVLKRPSLWLTLASLSLLVGIVWTAVSVQVNEWLADGDELQLYAWRILLAAGGFLALFRTLGFVSAASSLPRRVFASLLFVTVLCWPWYWQQTAWFWYPPDDQAEGSSEAPEPAPVKAVAAFDSEALLYQQPELIHSALAAVRTQTPGKIDLFSMGFAGDGSEKVFRNEVEYFGQLMSERFDASNRTLSLINAVETIEDVPLATLTNLRIALAGVAMRMDTSEDVLVLFLTSHGSEDHRLVVGLEPLPLKQIQPKDLRAALDDAGIRWRVVVVSSCYSGGFVDALRDPKTLVITASRADRTSFGCGSKSKITWFGKAFLTQALNQTADFERGFELASKQVREWELAEGQTASVPQIAGGWAIRKHLAEWRKTLAPSAAVNFSPK